MTKEKEALIIAFVLKSGGDFKPEDVTKIQDEIGANLKRKHRFVCFSDIEVPCERIPLLHDYPGWWSKLELFRPDIEGDMLYFDLDTVVCGQVDEIASVKELTMLKDLNKINKTFTSGVMFLPEKDRAEVWDRWIEKPEEFMRKLKGDQNFLNLVYGERPRLFQKMFPGQIVSFKYYILQRFRSALRRKRTEAEIADKVLRRVNVVCFHGYPRPHQVKRLKPWVNLLDNPEYYNGREIPEVIPKEVADRDLFNKYKTEFNIEHRRI